MLSLFCNLLQSSGVLVVNQICHWLSSFPLSNKGNISVTKQPLLHLDLVIIHCGNWLSGHCTFDGSQNACRSGGHFLKTLNKLLGQINHPKRVWMINNVCFWGDLSGVLRNSPMDLVFCRIYYEKCCIQANLFWVIQLFEC